MQEVNYTIVNNNARKELGLSYIEYCVADVIYHLTNNPDGDGWCSVSKEWMGKQFGITKRAINKIIARLIDKGLLEKKEDIINKSRGNKLRTTIDWYNITIIKGGNKNTHDGKRWEQSDQKVGTKVSKGGNKSDRILYNNDNNNDNNNDVATGVAGKEINSLMDYFKHINPNYEKLFSNKQERKSLQELVDKYGYEKMTNMLIQLPRIVSKPYAPRITSPYMLQKKLGELLIFIKQENNKGGVVDARHIK